MGGILFEIIIWSFAIYGFLMFVKEFLFEWICVVIAYIYYIITLFRKFINKVYRLIVIYFKRKLYK